MFWIRDAIALWPGTNSILRPVWIFRGLRAADCLFVLLISQSPLRPDMITANQEIGFRATRVATSCNSGEISLIQGQPIPTNKKNAASTNKHPMNVQCFQPASLMPATANVAAKPMRNGTIAKSSSANPTMTELDQPRFVARGSQFPIADEVYDETEPTDSVQEPSEHLAGPGRVEFWDGQARNHAIDNLDCNRSQPSVPMR